MAVLLNVLLSQLDPTGGLWSNIRPSQPPSSTLSWGASFRRLNPFNATKSIPDGDLHEDVYAIKELVKLAAVKLLDLCTETKYTFKCLYNISKDFFKDRLSFQMALLVLMSDSHISISKIDELQIVEIHSPGRTSPTSSSASKTTESELEVIRLTERIEDLELSMQNLEDQIQRLRDDAKAKLKAGDERQARRLLRQKKLLSDTLDQQERQQKNLSLMLGAINKTIAAGKEIETYRNTMELYDETKDFTLEDAIETRKEMSDAVEESEAAEEALSNGSKVGDDDEIERELRAIRDTDDVLMDVEVTAPPTAPTDPTLDTSAIDDLSDLVDEDLMDG